MCSHNAKVLITPTDLPFFAGLAAATLQHTLIVSLALHFILSLRYAVYIVIYFRIYFGIVEKANSKTFFPILTINAMKRSRYFPSMLHTAKHPCIQQRWVAVWSAVICLHTEHGKFPFNSPAMLYSVLVPLGLHLHSDTYASTASIAYM